MNKKNTFLYFKDIDFEKYYKIFEDEDLKYVFDIDDSSELQILKRFIYVEQLLSIAYLIKNYKKFKMNDVEMIMSGFGENFLPNAYSHKVNDIDEKEIMIIKTYWFLQGFVDNYQLKQLINGYLINSKEDKTKNIKLFQLTDDGYIIPKNEKTIRANNRYNIYINIIKNYIASNKLESDKEEEQYKNRKNNEENKKNKDNKKESILTKYIERKISQSYKLDEKSKHNYIDINNIINSVNIVEVAKDMDNLIKKNTLKAESHYASTLKNLKVLNYDGKTVVDNNKNLINLQGLYTHLAGKTGAGKSVEIDLLLKILSNHNKRILVITSNHGLSFKMKQQCVNLEIPSVMLMGRNREEYYNSFFNSLYIKKMQKTRINTKLINNANVLNFLQKNYKYFEDMENGCMNLAMKDEFEKEMNKDYTSDSLYKNCSKCEDIEKCSFMNATLKAFDDNTNVIIVPIQTLCKSNLIHKLDSERRTLLESLLLTVDLVITDEVDEIQSIIEGVFANENTIYTNNSQFNAQKEEGSLEFYKNQIHNIYRYDIANKYPKLNRLLYDVDTLINFIARYYLHGSNFKIIKKQIKLGISFDEESLVYDYLKKYFYPSQKDSELLSNKARSLIKILRSKKSIDFLNRKIERIIDKYTGHLNENSLSMITDTEEKTIRESFQKLFDAYIKEFNDEFESNKIPVPNNFGKANKKNNDNLVKFKIFIFLILKLKIDYNKLIREAEFKINTTRHKDSKTSNIPSLVKNLINNTICGFVIDEEEIEEKFRRQKNLYGRLKILKYDGIGREVLMSTNKYLSALHNIQPVPMLICSATSLDTKSSLYTIKYPVNLILQNKKQLKNKEELNQSLKVKCHIFQLNGQICTTSGDFKNRHINTENMCIAMKTFLEKTIDKTRKRNEGILLVSPSAEISYVIYNKLSEIFKSSDVNIKILHTPGHKEAFDHTKHIDRNSVELCAEKKVDILIAVNQTIARGYNILKNVEGELDKSYFTEIIMFNRFLPSPDDYLSHISFAHAELTNMFKKNSSIENMGDYYDDVVFNANQSLSYVKYIHGFNQLPNKLKQMIIGNIYCLLNQIKGRGQRGGSTCTIHLIDANCYPNTAKLAILGVLTDRQRLASSSIRTLTEEELEYDDNSSMLQGLIDILNTDDELINLLFDDMKEAFNNHTFYIH